jgi:transposase
VLKSLALGINANFLPCRKHEVEAKARHVFCRSGNPRDEEVVALKRELIRVKKERDFLREAEMCFSRELS